MNDAQAETLEATLSVCIEHLWSHRSDHLRNYLDIIAALKNLAILRLVVRLRTRGFTYWMGMVQPVPVGVAGSCTLAGRG